MLIPRFWWPPLRLDIQQWLNTCPACQINSRRGRVHHDEMHPFKVPTAFDRWHLDFLDLPMTLKGNRWLLIGVDYATNWCVARAVPVASKEAVADFIYEEIVMNFGVMSEIVTDRGANFTSALVQEYTKRIGAKFKLTSAYHPRTNSKAERFNGVIKQMLRKYTNGALHRWDDFVHAALWSCRIRIHSTTGFSPFYLTYGREPKLPGDTLHPYIDSATFKDPRTVADITSRELTRLGQHRAAAEFRLKAMAEKDKIRWDAAIKKLTFELGDMVMLTHEGRYGLEPQFKGPFIVVEAFPDYGTYQLQTLAGEPLKSLVHVDRLRPAKGDRPSEPWYDPTTARREYNDAMKSVPAPLRGDNVDPVTSPTPIDIYDVLENEPVDTAITPIPIDAPNETIVTHPSEVPFVEPVHESPVALTPVIDELSIPEEDEVLTEPTPPLTESIFFPSAPVGLPTSSVQGRTQSLKGGNVSLESSDGMDVQDSGVPSRTVPVSGPTSDIPVEIEIMLKKKSLRKRKFTPNICNTHQRNKKNKK